MVGLEPTRSRDHRPLKPARLPITPHAQVLGNLQALQHFSDLADRSSPEVLTPADTYQGFSGAYPGALVARMVPVGQEVLVHLDELSVDPEAPLANLRTGDDHGPCTALIRKDGVLMLGVTVSDRRSFEVLITRRRSISIAALEDERHERPRMIMLRAVVVRS